MRFNNRAVLLLAILGLALAGLFNSQFFQPVEANTATITSAIVSVQQTNLNLNPGAQLYVYGLVTGGGYPTGSFSNGPYGSVTDAAGYLVAALALTTSNTNSFNTQTAYYDIGGASVSGFSQYSASYGVNAAPGTTGASDTFTVVSSGSLVVVFGLGGGEQCLTVSGLPGFSIDATDNQAAGLPPVITIGHVYLDPGTYTATEQTQQCAAGQDPTHAGDLIGVIVFTSGAGSATTTTAATTTAATTSATTATAPALIINSVSPIFATKQQTIYISGSGFGNTPPQTVPVGDGSVNTYACNVNTPSLAIWDNGGGSHDWSAGRQTCSNVDTVGVFCKAGRIPKSF